MCLRQTGDDVARLSYEQANVVKEVGEIAQREGAVVPAGESHGILLKIPARPDGMACSGGVSFGCSVPVAERLDDPHETLIPRHRDGFFLASGAAPPRQTPDGGRDNHVLDSVVFMPRRLSPRASEFLREFIKSVHELDMILVLHRDPS